MTHGDHAALGKASVERSPNPTAVRSIYTAHIYLVGMKTTTLKLKVCLKVSRMFVYKQKRGFASRVGCYNVESLSHTQDVILFSLDLLHVCVVNTQQPFNVNITNWECFQKLMMPTLSYLKLFLIAKLCITCIIATISGCNYLHLELEKRKCSFFLFTCVLNLTFMLSIENLCVPPMLSMWVSTLSILQITFPLLSSKSQQERSSSAFPLCVK